MEQEQANRSGSGKGAYQNTDAHDEGAPDVVVERACIPVDDAVLSGIATFVNKCHALATGNSKGQVHVGICCRESLKNTRSDSRIVLASNPIVFRAGFTFVLHRLLRVGVLGRTGLGSVRSLGICTAFCSTLCWMAPDAPGPFRFLEIVVVVQVAEVLFVRHDRRVQPAVLETKRPTLQTWNMTGAKPASCSPGRVVLVIAMACPCWKT